MYSSAGLTLTTVFESFELVVSLLASLLVSYCFPIMSGKSSMMILAFSLYHASNRT